MRKRRRAPRDPTAVCHAHAVRILRQKAGAPSSALRPGRAWGMMRGATVSVSEIDAIQKTPPRPASGDSIRTECFRAAPTASTTSQLHQQHLIRSFG